MQLLKDKTAVITGGSSGIGKSICELFVEHGAKVVVSDLDEEAGLKLVENLNKNGEMAHFVKTDVSSASSCKAMVEQAVNKFGRLDIAVNNAGIADGETATGDKDLDHWRKVIDVNLNGVFYCMRYEIPEILKQGGGAIVNMGSILSTVGFATASAYVAAKHGMMGLTKNAALEYASKNIRINAIGPAFINTPLLASMDDDTIGQLKKAHPIGRLGEPKEVAELALWLCSSHASFCHGGYYPVDGGYLSQ